MSVTAQQAISLLENVLFETATQAAANAQAWITNPAAASISTLAAAMAASPEESLVAHVVGYYLTSLGRAPNADEIRYYLGIAEQGLTPSQIAAGQVPSSTWDTIAKYFAHSPEFATRGGIDYSLGATAALFEAVPWLYQSVLGRAPSSAELAYYDNQALNGADLGVLFREFTASPEFHADTDAQIAAALADYGTAAASGQPTSAGIGTSVDLGPPPPPAPTPTPAPTPVPTALTAGTDTYTTSNASLVYTGTLGTGATLTANDSLTGAGNTLNITDSTAGHASQDLMPSGVSLTGIAAISLTTTGNAGTDSSHRFDLSSFASVTSFTLDAAGAQGDFIKVGSGVALSVTSASAMIDISGAFASLALTDSSVTSLSVTGNGVLGSSGSYAALPSTLTTISLSADNATLYLTLQSAGATLMAGGGNDHITDTHGGNSVSAGNGANTILNSGTVGADTITVGNGNNTITDHSTSSGGSITVGTGYNTIDVASHGGSVLHLGPDANYSTDDVTPNVVVENATAGVFIEFTGSPSLAQYTLENHAAADVTSLIHDMEIDVAGNPRAAVAQSLGGNTYIVESSTGIVGPTDTVIVELIGIHGINISSGQIVLAS